MAEPFEVLLADGISRLDGRAGDWLVDYGDGSLDVVPPALFTVTYELTCALSLRLRGGIPSAAQISSGLTPQHLTAR